MKRWYAVFAKPRKEHLAEANLQRQDFETYLPLIQGPRRRRGRWQPVVEPLFPRYLFLHTDTEVQSTASVRSTQGVVGLVRFGGYPVAVPDRLIETLRTAADSESGLHGLNPTPFEPGDKVRIVDGPFSDLVGVFQCESGEQRAMILLELLGRENRVQVQRNDLIGLTS